MATKARPVWTIGYEGLDVETFVGRLVEHQIEVLVDVRENAISRKRGFSKRALGEAVNDAGIRYEHVRSLGNPKANRDAFRSGEPAARRRYVAYVNNGSRPDYDQLVSLCEELRVALLCFEHGHHSCHRSCLTEQMSAEGPFEAVPL